jgi:hypothetical protein
MANRETFPAAQSPLTGDISGAAGATNVTVVGLQTIPLAPTPPTDEETIVFDAQLGLQGEWTPRLDANISVTIGEFLTDSGEIISRGRKLSDDYDFLVNRVGLDVLVGWSHGFAFQVFVNGTGVV